MALKIADRVRETTTTTGTGTINLGGAVTNFETFAANLSNSDTTYYAIVDNTNGDFEVGLGTFATGSPNTLARTTPISSSNSNSAVNFGAGTKDVFITTPASKMAFLNASGSLISSGGTSLMEVANDTTPQLGGDLDVNGNSIVSTSNGNIAITPNGSGVVRLDGNVDIQSGTIDLKNSGSRSKINFYCESGNAHAQSLQAAPHSESASNTLTLPSTGGDVDLVSTASTATLTNKTLTSPKINEDVALTATATELNLLDGVSGLVQADFTKLAAVDSTSTELNLVDGSSAGTIVNSKAVIYGSSGEVNATTLQIAGTSITASAADINLIDGITNGTVIASKAIITDANKDISGGRNITISGELDAATLDISGDADIDGTLEADAITVNGSTLNSVIADEAVALSIALG